MGINPWLVSNPFDGGIYVTLPCALTIWPLDRDADCWAWERILVVGYRNIMIIIISTVVRNLRPLYFETIGGPSILRSFKMPGQLYITLPYPYKVGVDICCCVIWGISGIGRIQNDSRAGNGNDIGITIFLLGAARQVLYPWNVGRQ